MDDNTKIVVCTNAEHLRKALNIPCEASADDAHWMIWEWRDALSTELERVGFGDRIETDRNFHNWNGGKYGSQAAMYGYETRNVVSWRGVDAWVIDEAMYKADKALDRARVDWVRETIERWLEDHADTPEAEQLRNRIELGIHPSEARILDRIARDAGILSDG